MLTAAHVAGVAPHLALGYTHRMLGAIMDATAVVERGAMKRALWQAYMTEGYARQKKLPNLGAELRKLDPPRIMSPKEQRDAIIQMAKAMGAEIVYGKEGS